MDTQDFVKDHLAVCFFVFSLFLTFIIFLKLLNKY